MYRQYARAHVPLKQPHKRPVHSWMHKSLGGVRAVGNDAGRIVLQNCRNILLGGNKIDHAHRTPLIGKQIKRAVKGVFPLHGGNFRNRLTLVNFVFRPRDARRDNVLPADQQRNIFKVASRLHALSDLRPERRLSEIFTQRLEPALLALRGQDVNELCRARRIRVRVAENLHAALPRPRHPAEHIGRRPVPVRLSDGF